MVIDSVFNAYDFDFVVAYTGSDITEAMIDKCLEIDRDFYDDEYFWNAEEVKKAVKNYGQFCFVYVDRQERRVIGYTFWFPIKTKVFNHFIKEKTMLLEIKEEFCTDFKGADTVNLFLGGEAFVTGYNIRDMHKAVEDLFQMRIMDLAHIGVKVKYVAMESCCRYDEEFLLPRLGLTNLVRKDKSKFYFDNYSPKVVYKDSKYAKSLEDIYI